MNTHLLFTILGLNHAPMPGAEARTTPREETAQNRSHPDDYHFGAEVGRSIRDAYTLLTFGQPPRRSGRDDRW